MKRYIRTFRFKLILHILMIALNLILTTGLILQFKNPWILSFLIFVFPFQVYYLVRLMETSNRSLVRFLEAIQYADFNQSFSDRKLGKSFEELQKAFTNVTEAFKKQRAEREKSYRYMSTIVQYINNGLISYDKNGTVDFINRAAKKILKLHHLKNIDQIRNVNPALFRIMTSIRHGERIIRKISVDDDAKQMALSGFEFKIGDKELTLLSIQDIHSVLEDKELDAWQKLIRVLTHEIMNSLTPISSLSATTHDLMQQDHSEQLQDSEHLQDIKEALETIHNRSKGLIDFVSAYRNLALIPNPIIKIIPVKEVISRTLKILSNKIQENRIDVAWKVDPESLEISADISLIEQVMINLVINSIQALTEEESPKIRINSYLNDNGQVIIQIKDNGIGINENNKGKIFVPFFSTKKSSGIGLSLCKQIMKLHKGQISAATTETETVFTLSF